MSEEYQPKALRCPKCGQNYEFQVSCSGRMTAYMDGEGLIEEIDHTHPEIRPNCFCVCPECQYYGALHRFEVEE